MTSPRSSDDSGFSQESFEKGFTEEARKLGRVNIALFGKTGVGKSTLLNAIFGQDVVETGIGAPVTKGSSLYLHRNGFLGIIDNEGLEIGKNSDEILRDLKNLVEASRGADVSEQLHVAWYCVRAGDNRFESTEADFIRRLHELGVPIVLVLTRATKTPGGQVHRDNRALARHIEGLHLPIDGNEVVITSAVGDSELGFAEFGVQELLDRTFRLAPEAVRLALTAAQTYDRRRKADAANVAVRAAVVAATAAGATPIPFSDAAVLVPIQMAMMIRIAHVYDIGLEKSSAMAVTATTVATTAGKSLVTGLLKMVPGVNVAAMAISAGVAGAITAGMGAAWHEVCLRISSGELDPDVLADNAKLAELFTHEFKKASGSTLRSARRRRK